MADHPHIRTVISAFREIRTSVIRFEALLTISIEKEKMVMNFFK